MGEGRAMVSHTDVWEMVDVNDYDDDMRRRRRRVDGDDDDEDGGKW